MAHFLMRTILSSKEHKLLNKNRQTCLVFKKSIYCSMKHSLVRQTIVETAARLFYQNGYNLTGINEIIKEAGIAKATLYSHFKSKEDICIAYLDYKNDEFVNQITAFTLAKPKGKAQLLAIFDFLKLFYAKKDFNGCWCINTISEIPRENEKIRSKIQKQKNDFLQLIQQIASANFPNQSTKENQILAKRIYLLYEGALTESHIHQQAWPIASAKELCGYILAG